ncbi:MAG TPA: 23S rRNA (adenine(2030)-N(6))-methyltransferase RlmJ, partial [Burkholderiales bacterium]|nr:23S rRNA (adenine(2030)-N(6))-methyltransferase RlmJ [Burkholderiales bacterium]
RVAEALATAHERWATGSYAAWYPLMEPPAMRAFERDIIATGIRKILQLELSVRPEGWTTSLRGCGMLVVNPPFHFEDEAAAMLEWLWRALTREGDGGRRVRWLVPE